MVEIFSEIFFYFILNMHIFYSFCFKKKQRKEVPLPFELHSILTCKIRIAAATIRFVV